MRIAYTLNGLIGGFGNYKTYNIDKLSNYGDESSLTLKYASKFLKKYVLDNNDVDVFVFSWQVDKLEEFKKYLNPKKIKVIPQIDFEIPKHLMLDLIYVIINHLILVVYQQINFIFQFIQINQHMVGQMKILKY